MNESRSVPHDKHRGTSEQQSPSPPSPSPSPDAGGASPPPPCGRPRRSKFTYRQLAQLAASNTATPLRVIAHIDLDAFYAQCEMVRLGIPEDQPLAVQQWQGLIAINYPARKWGIGRHCNVAEAKKMCPDLIAQHVATWREGDDSWAYRDDAPANMATDKVSLDPYRLQSRRILALVKDALPRHLQRVEKASIDEVFLDLSAQVHAELLRRFPELASPPPYDDVTETLPYPPVASLDWGEDALVPLAAGGDQNEDGSRAGAGAGAGAGARNEDLDPDWDDVAILIGSEIVRDIRAQVRAKLGYTCSAGIASNKLVSKLGSAFKKPNRQTVVRARAVEAFLAGTKISKMRNLGGKLGEQVISTFGTDNVRELLGVPLEQMAAKLGHETGLWVHNTIRGIDHSEVNSRTQIKSMLSAKSFRPFISTPDQAVRWLRIFVGDIFSRLVEEGVLDNRRRPRTINLHHRHGGQTKSRQAPIPTGKALDEQLLFSLAQHLLQQIISEGNVWPCANLSLSVGSFEDGVKGNMGIGAFLVKGDEAASTKTVPMPMPAQPMPESPDPESHPPTFSTDQPKKRLRSDDAGIERFFAKRPPSDRIQPAESASSKPTCGPNIALQSHEDWHFAVDLQEQERGRATLAQRPGTPRGGHIQRGTGASSNKRDRNGTKLEQGQSRLKFG
ncbi:N-acetyltransferase eso1 [Escovopsis weberi]|uniref:DNA polymerase eta n=1 Tax=Escovopsis weberi TaxID=150374 RepID=A0A0M8N8R7_ESCWE|nr:N-acetyltransferase eso1 [Escovopsis weberi]